MTQLLIGHESFLRFGAFLAVLGAMAAWELVSPRRSLRQPKSGRWLVNLTIMVLNTELARILVLVTAVGVAHLAASRGFCSAGC